MSYFIHFQYLFPQGLVTIVTGGSSGLGRAAVERMARGGSHVVIADLPNSPGKDVIAAIDGKGIFVPTDVRLCFVCGYFTHSLVHYFYQSYSC
jgi:NAD(P)-dependent dehydrogenase (short-subunit alcohol dehydrogenase family)